MIQSINPWNGMLAPKPPNFYTTKIVDSSLRHEFMWAVDRVGRKGFAITLPQKIHNKNPFPSLENILVEWQPNKKTIVMILTDDELGRQFRIFCEDCISSVESNTSKNSEAVIINLTATIKHWETLLKDRKKELSLSMQLGLIGELLMIRDVLMDLFLPADCIQGWKGPEGHEQDFLINSSLVEVKCQLSSKDKVVKISSLEQLDGISGQIYLTHFGLGMAESKISDAFSLPSIVDDIIRYINADNYLIDTFIGKLELVNYFHGATECPSNYVKSFQNIYKVDTDFPKIIRANVHSSIENSSYNLNMGNLEKWKIEVSQMAREISK